MMNPALPTIRSMSRSKFYQTSCQVAHEMRRHQLRRVTCVLGDARARWCWLVLLWLGLSGVASAQAPWEARAGVLDVRTWDTREMIPVLGEWQFAYLDLREPQADEARVWQTRIGAWQGGFPETPYGYGTYRLLVQLPKAGLYGLRLAEIDTAYKLWIDGELQTEVGRVGMSRADVQPYYDPQVIAFYGEDVTEIVMQVANYHYPTALLRSSDGEASAKIHLGTLSQLTQDTNRRTRSALLLSGILAAMAGYHLLIYLQRRQMMAFLYFAVFCLLLLLRDSVNGEVLLNTLVPLPFEWQMALDYGCAFAIGPSLLLYLRSLFPQELRGWLFRSVVLAFVPFIVLVVVLPARFFIAALPAFLPVVLVTLLYVVGFVVVALWRRRDGILYVVLGVLSIAAGVSLDVLFLFDFTPVGGFLNLGFLGFIAAQALLLSRRSVRAYERFEALSYELEAANSQLEARVKARTLELEHASERIRSLNRRLEAENARMGSELSVTRRLQELLLPAASELQQVRSELIPLDIAAMSLPASEVGGDYYDVLPFADKLLIGMGDVTGHGLESGMVMLMTQMGVRTLLEANHHDPVDILTILNRSLYKNVMRMQAHKSLSLVLLSYHYDASQATGKLTVSGQHETLLLFAADGTLSCVDTLELGFPLALEEDIRPFLAQMTLRLEPGAGVVVFSDGITEAPNPQGTLYGLSRLAEVIGQHWHAPAKSIRDAVLGDVYRFINDTPDIPADVVRILHDQDVEDDITLLIVKQH